MPKMKTHKGIKKRMRVTRKGKVIHSRANRSHLLSGRSSKRKRRLRRGRTVTTVQANTYRRLLEG
jgi:large subunit ribosomal protein L35